MEPSTANTLLSDHIIKALCNTLMHSLWQGVLLAVAAGIIIVFTKKASAAYRYNLLLAAMVLFACGTVFTFLWQMREPQSSSAAYGGYAAVGNTNFASRVNNVQATVTPGIKQNAKESITETVISYFNAHYNAIVLIWFLIICAKSIQMAVGLHSVFHLKRTKVFAVDKYWRNKLLQLAEQLQINQAISLLESGIAKVPMVIGHLKPVILIPIGLINSLSAEEVEAILVHELAHIRRRDYLVNLLQSFMEIAFFFNPAVLWISQLIKTERENCCDDLALQQSSDKVSYIQALVSCEEYKSVIPAHVMAFPGSKNTLLDRVKRMAGNGNHSLNMFEKTVLAICLVVSGLCVSAFTAREDIKKALKSVAAVIQHDVKAESKSLIKAVKDTTVKKQPDAVNNTATLLAQLQKPALSGTDTGKSAGASALKLLTDKIDSLSGNDGTRKSPLAALAKLDTANYKKFHNIGLELYREHLVTDTNHLNISLNDRELIVNGVRMPEDVFERITRQFNTRGNYGVGYAKPYGNKYPGSYDAQLKEKSEQIAWELLKENLVKDKTYFTFKLSKDDGLYIDGVKQPDDLYSRIVGEYFKPDDDFNINYTFQDPGIYGPYHSGPYAAQQTKRIIDQMQREGLIDNRKDLSFSLTDKKFVINGKVQGEDVFQRYRNEYVPANAVNWHWGYNGPREVYYSPRNGGLYYANPWAAAGYNSPDEWSRVQSEERKRVEDERDKKLVADLLQDGLITDPKNVTFTITNKKLTINGKKQSDEVYKKYKDKYLPDNNEGNWSWTYGNHQ